MKKPKFAHKVQRDDTAEPFLDAESAELLADDCDRYFFGDAPDLVFCKHCDCAVTPHYFPRSLKLPKNWDAGCTYDGRLIVSAKFGDICYDLGLGSDVSFLRVDEERSTFLLHPRRILPVDVGQGVIWRRSHWCSHCSSFTQGVMPDPFRLAPDIPPLRYGVRRSDIQVGSLRARLYFIFVGTETKKQLENLNLKSLYFDPVPIVPGSPA